MSNPNVDKQRRLRSVVRWRWFLPVAMGIMFLIFNTYAPFAYERLAHAVPLELAARGVRRMGIGTGYGTRSSLMSVAAGGHLLLYWSAIAKPSLASIAGSLTFSLPGVLIFWLWVWWVIDTRGLPISPHGPVSRILLTACYFAALIWAVRRALWSFDFAIINGAGNVRHWVLVFSHGFISTSLNWFVGGVWLLILAFLLVITSIRLWQVSTRIAVAKSP